MVNLHSLTVFRRSVLLSFGLLHSCICVARNKLACANSRLLLDIGAPRKGKLFRDLTEFVSSWRLFLTSDCSQTSPAWNVFFTRCIFYVLNCGLVYCLMSVWDYWTKTGLVFVRSEFLIHPVICLRLYATGYLAQEYVLCLHFTLNVFRKQHRYYVQACERHRTKVDLVMKWAEVRSKSIVH